ncbi:2846_t:CDS:1, partial [Diversispora eburnea]
RTNFTKAKKRTSAQVVFTLTIESKVTSILLLARGETKIKNVLILDDNKRQKFSLSQ